MTTTFTLALKAPLPLPAEGVTSVAFKAHINSLVPFLEQDLVNYDFMEEGLYATWTARQDGMRISDLAGTDPEKVKLDKQKADQTITSPEHETKIADLKKKRNSQLAKFIQLIVVSCHYTEHTDIAQLSTSFGWVIKYLEGHYNIQSKGAHFMNVAKISYKKGTLPQTFYKQFRAAFHDNLRKKGDTLLHKNSIKLQEDESLNSSFESTIVLWTLEKIDPRLPARVAKLYGHQMTGDKTLIDLQSTIFQDVPSILLELDDGEQRSTLGATNLDDEDETHLNYGGGENRNQRYKRNPSTRARGYNKTYTNNNNRNQDRKSGSGPRKSFCRMCKLAGSTPSVYNSHEIGECRMLTKSDLGSIVKLNTLEEDDGEKVEKPDRFYEPGWDDEEEAGDDGGSR
eukprot:GFUD01068343.1.p1 GENE.GFUD01068343.1~~GFUD01068343.1.p1  ORF type:complete len:398 (-),score=107.92 GFUD01068343.1:150-1343(-)